MNPNDENTEMGTHETPPEQAESVPDRKVDRFLESLVLNAEEHGMPWEITLTVGGMLVSGVIDSGRKYFDYHIEAYAKALGVSLPLPDVDGHEENSADLEPLALPVYVLQVDAQSYADILDKRRKALDEEDTDGLQELLPKYIHLRDVTISHPAMSHNGMKNLPWWRGLLESVDGFILGRMVLSVSD